MTDKDKIMNDILKPEGEYSKSYHCDNCGESFTQFFQKGVRASQGVCPNCGCSPKPEYRKDKGPWY